MGFDEGRKDVAKPHHHLSSVGVELDVSECLFHKHCLLISVLAIRLGRLPWSQAKYPEYGVMKTCTFICIPKDPDKTAEAKYKKQKELIAFSPYSQPSGKRHLLDKKCS